jgi:pimeloyl-ACP methyl ester carboxylesterase
MLVHSGRRSRELLLPFFLTLSITLAQVAGRGATITARVLILRSERDFWSRPEDVTTLERDLKNAASVRAVTIPDATHYVHLDRAEKGRAAFMAEVGRFLDLR